MMMNKAKCSAAGVLLLASGFLQAAAPSGWLLAGGNPRNYETGIDSKTTFGGEPSAYLKTTSAAPEAPQGVQNFGTLMQMFNATKEYAGQRVRFSAYVKSDNVTDWAALWMRVDRKGSPTLSFDNMQNRAIKGTTEWQRYEVVLDVQADATAIAFGILLAKSGAVWLTGVKFEIVGASVPVTNMLAAPTAPQNLNFEK
ncbi:MAG TPA: hypothetical protein VG297_00580 [Bryobacteraceae bacterium]|jgi:hypothetical protein|nr:hypothetical protein [Bryobacteraceae bacterium]